jgi:DNA-binding ferritin-like protein
MPLYNVASALYLARWVHQHNHWVTKGDMYYADHLLYQRVYEGIDDEIDTLMEKWQAMSLNLPEMSSILAKATEWLAKAEAIPSLPQRSLFVEKTLQKTIEIAFKNLESSGQLTLGLDDFLAALANKRDTSVYLLQQRVGVDLARRTAKKAPAVKPGLPKGPPYDQMFKNPNMKEVTQFAESGDLSNTLPGHSRKAPPTPNDSLLQPGSETLSTLNRLRVPS